MLYTDTIRNDHQKIVAVLSYMTSGNTSTWATAYYTADWENIDNIVFAAFVKELDDYFANLLKGEKACRELFTLTYPHAQDVA